MSPFNFQTNNFYKASSKNQQGKLVTCRHKSLRNKANFSLMVDFLGKSGLLEPFVVNKGQQPTWGPSVTL